MNKNNKKTKCNHLDKSFKISFMFSKNNIHRCKILYNRGKTLLCTGLKPYPKKCPNKTKKR